MNIIDKFFGWIFSLIYNIVGDYIVIIIVAAIIVSAIRILKLIFQLWNQKENAILYPDIQKIKRDKALTDIEKAEKIDSITSKRGKFIVINTILSVLLYFITIAVFAVSLNPKEHIQGMIEETSLSFWFFEDLLKIEFNIIIPLICSALSAVGKNFLIPKKYLTPEKIKDIVLKFVLETATLSLISLIAAHTYLLLQLLIAIMVFVASIVLTPFKIKVGNVCEESRKINEEEIQKENSLKEAQEEKAEA